MAIEEHPQFSEWSDALDQLVTARDKYHSAKAFGARNLDPLEQAVFSAMQRFLDLSDKIDGYPLFKGSAGAGA